MIALLWLLACLLLWLLALTVALPLTLALKFSETLRYYWFSWFYVYLIGPTFQSKTIPYRTMTFEPLKNRVASRGRRLEVLEIGPGEGANLPYYPDNCNLTVVDKNKYFVAQFERNVQKYPHISYQRAVLQHAEHMKGVEDNSMDVVVSSYFQCSCDDPDLVLQEIIRVLKPGGIYVCMEHVCFPKGDVGLYLQLLISPLWYIFSNGCVAHRDLAKKIRGVGFSEVKCKTFIAPHWWMYLAKPHLIAVATK